jgi:hypothetical protein
VKVFAVFVLLFGLTLTTQADTITDNLAAMLTADSSLPLAPGVAMELAQNLIAAQDASSYAANEPDSLTLSFESVLRAISTEIFPGGPSEITNGIDTPNPFIQSNIAIDDRAGVAIYVDGVLYQNGDVIDFGTSSSTFTVETPEPRTLWLLLTALLLLALGHARAAYPATRDLGKRLREAPNHQAARYLEHPRA